MIKDVRPQENDSLTIESKPTYESDNDKLGWISKGIFWIGMIVIGILLVPTGILFALICGVWSVTNWITTILSEQVKQRRYKHRR